VTRGRVAAACFLLVCGAFLLTTGRSFALYHESMPEHSTAVVVTNLDSVVTSVAFSVYDAYGALQSRSEIVLDAQASEALFIDGMIEAVVGTTWGLVSAETEGHVAFGVWIAVDGAWRCVENVATALLDPTDLPYSAYWYTVDYASTGSRKSQVGVVNPWSEPVSAEMEVHDASGAIAAHFGLNLDGHASGFYDLSGGLGTDSMLWGSVVVRATAPVLLVAEYRDDASTLIDIDMTTKFFFIEE